jgi:DNA-binding NarL/FixJ family response regulator
VETEIRLVIADDHPLVCQALRNALAAEPSFHIIGEAHDGQAALELIQQTRPELAILDIRMPKLDGFALARTLHQQQLPTQVIILTGAEDPETLQTALQAGVRGYVRKESAVVEILTCVKAVAAGRLFISAGFEPAPTSLPAPTPAGLQDLTPAERRILKLIAEGKGSKEIATLLRINYRTVDNHRTNISQKLDLHGSHALLRFAIEHKAELF